MTVRLCTRREKMVGNVSDVSAALQGVNDSDTPINLGSDYNFDGERTSLAANIGGTPNFDTTEGSEAFTDFTSGTDDFVNNYGYDALSDMTSISQIAQTPAEGTSANEVAAKVVTMSYDADQRLSTLDMDQTVSDVNTLVSSAAYTYDADSELTDLVYYANTSHTGTPLAGYHYDYNTAGIVGDEYSRNDTSGTIGSSDTSWAETTYSYDPGAQLIGATYSSNFAGAPSTFGATYDPNGNRTDDSGTSEASATDRVLFDGTYYYTYDAEGNRTAKYQNSTDKGLDSSATDITIYTWNNANQMTSATQFASYADMTADPPVSDWSVTYGVDPFGRMVTRTATVTADDVTTTTTENFIYDGLNIVLVLNGAGQVLERNLTGPAADEVYATEEVLTVTSGTQAAGTVNWLLTDAQGTVRDVVQYDTDTDATEEVDHLVYSAFGQLLSQTADPSSGDRPIFYYNGTWQDQQTGLNEMGLRWYDAQSGDWASEDPISFGGGQTNLSEFVGNSPTNFTDPSGLAAIPGVVLGQKGVYVDVNGKWVPIGIPVGTTVDSIGTPSFLAYSWGCDCCVGGGNSDPNVATSLGGGGGGGMFTLTIAAASIGASPTSTGDGSDGGSGGGAIPPSIFIRLDPTVTSLIRAQLASEEASNELSRLVNSARAYNSSRQLPFFRDCGYDANVMLKFFNDQPHHYWYFQEYYGSVFQNLHMNIFQENAVLIRAQNGNQCPPMVFDQGLNEVMPKEVFDGMYPYDWVGNPNSPPPPAPPPPVPPPIPWPPNIDASTFFGGAGFHR